LFPDPEVKYDGSSLPGRVGGGSLWQRFAYRKASRSRMRYAGSSARFSRRILSKK
jgi:hypothetical protein